VAHDAISGLQKAYALKPDLIILDIMLPDIDGWQTCRRFREMSDVPIVMLTALGSQESMVQGLELGADAYLVKPVTTEELVARIRALLRRASRSKFDENSRTSIFSYGNLVIDFDKREVTVDHQRVDLTPIEFRLLSILAQHKGRVVPHEYLLREIWGPDYVDEIHYLRLYISYLRHKIEKNASKPRLIYNEWGVGYRLG
jgi:two-component system KDP operon response regulator KdpE